MFQGVKKILTAAITFVAASASYLALAQSPPCLRPPSALASWWPGDDHLFDRAGQNHAFFRNGAKFGPGIVEQGFEFDGQDDYIEARADGMAVRQGDFSIEGWCKTTAAKEWSAIAEFEGHAPGLYLTGASGALRLWPAAASASGGFNDGQFHHFAVTRRDGTITYYKDGAAIGTAPSTTDIQQNRFFIGHDHTAGAGFSGVIDELAFYTRALSDAEVASIAGAGSAGKCKPSAPLPSVPFFIEAEDFDFDGGQHLAAASAPGYQGAAYAGKSAVAGIDYNDPGANESVAYRSGDQGVAMSAFYDLYRDSYELATDYRIGWIDAGDWFNYTRVFPLPARDYYLFARLSSAGLSNAVRVDLVTAGAKTANQTLSKIGEARGPATGDWNNFRYQPALNDDSELAVVRLGGEATLRVTALPESNQDFGFLQLVPVPPASSEPCSPAPGGMAAWWPGEDSGADQASAARHGVLTNGIAFAAGKTGRAFALDGRDDYVDTPLDAQPSALPTTTWEAWVFPARPGPRQQILSTDDGGYDRSVLVEGGGFGVFTGWGVWVPTLLSPNQWQHIAVVFSPTNVLFYKNGIRFQYGGAPTGQGTLYKLQIGRNPGFGEYFQGQIDEVTVYDRALSTEEIQGIVRAGGAGKCHRDDCPPLAISPAALPAGQSGAFYAQGLTGSGGAAPYAFAIVGGTLPPNLAVSPQGMLSGTVSESGTYSFLATVTDANGCSSSQLFTLDVSDPPGTCTPAPAGLASWWKAEDNAQDSAGSNHGAARNGASYINGAVGRAFQFDGTGVIEAGTNGLHVGLGDFSVEGWVRTTATKSYSTLISFDSYNPGFYVRGDGRLGHYHLSINDLRSTEAGFNDGQWHHFAIVRQDGFLSYYKDGRPSGTHTTPYNATINPRKVYIGGDTDGADYLTGGIDEISFYHRALSASEVSQIFSAGSAGKCAVEECPVITLKPALPDGRAQTDYDELLTATGGKAPYAFTLESGNLPAGLTLSAAGELRGRPTTAGSFQFVVTAADQDGCGAQQSYAFVVQPAPAGPDISLASSTMSFGTVAIGQTREQPLTIRNTGGGPLTISSVTSSNPRFNVTFSSPLSVAAGASADLVIRFAPLSAGEQTGQISITSDDPDQPMLSATLSGSGLAENQAPWRLTAEALPSRQTRFTAPIPFILQTATNLTPPVIWMPLTNQATGDGNNFSIILADSSPSASRFFRGLSGTNLDLNLPDDWKPTFPVLASSQGMITAASGGTISLPGGATVEIPAGSVPQDTLITVTKLDMSEYSGGIARDVYRVEAGNARLLKPAVLTFPLPDPRPGDENAETHVFRETDGEEVVELPAQVNAQARTVRVTTDRFSVFGVESDSSYLFNYATVGSTVGNHLLDVPYYNQGGTMWCFAAASQMLMKYYGVDVETWEVARFFNLPASEGVVIWRLWAGNYRPLFSSRGLKVRETCSWMMAARFNGYLIQQIDAGRPVWVGVQNGAHAVVVAGYNADGVFIHDPSGYSLLVGAPGPLRETDMASHFLTWDQWKKAVFSTKGGWNNVSPMPAYTIVLEGSRDPAASTLSFNLRSASVVKNPNLPQGEEVLDDEEMGIVRPLPRGDAAPLEARFSFDGSTQAGYKFYPEGLLFGPPYSAANSDEMHLALQLHNSGTESKTASVAVQLDGLDIYRSPQPFTIPAASTLRQLDVFPPSARYRFRNGPDGAPVPGKYPLTAQLISENRTVDAFRLELEIAPARPTNLTTTLAGDGVRLAWPANPEETKTPILYRIFQDGLLKAETSAHDTLIPGTLSSAYSITAYHPESGLESPSFTAPFIESGTFVRDTPVIQVRQIRGSLSTTNLTITGTEAYTRGPTSGTNNSVLRLFWEPPPSQVQAGQSFPMIIYADLGGAPATYQSSVAPPPRLYGAVNEVPSEFQSDNALVGYLSATDCGSGCYRAWSRLRIATPSITPEAPNVRIEFRLIRASGVFSSSEFEGTITWNYRRVQ